MNPIAVVVDANPGIRSLVAMELRRAGIQVVAEGGTGHDAISLASDVQPDVLVLDHPLPELAGLDAIPHIRSASPRTCIVLFSATSELRLDLVDSEKLPDAVVDRFRGLGEIAVSIEACLQA